MSLRHRQQHLAYLTGTIAVQRLEHRTRSSQGPPWGRLLPDHPPDRIAPHTPATAVASCRLLRPDPSPLGQAHHHNKAALDHPTDLSHCYSTVN